MKRRIVIDGDIAHVPLTQGYVAIIDARDVSLVQPFNWSVLISARTAYAKRNDWSVEKQRTVLLHRVIADAAPHVRIDHKNGDGLDCRRSNLRSATYQQNNLNTRRHRDGRLGLKGIQQHNRRFSASIQIAGVRHHLGMFATPEEAHAAYCAANVIYHGEFGRTT